jgi:hypothetical protein
MRSFSGVKRVPNSGVLMGFKNIHFPSPLLMYHKGRYVTIWGREGDGEIVIWEIILRDFWGAILRPLVMAYRRSDANARV